MNRTDCEAFLRRLDQGEAGARLDPHPSACAACRGELRVAILVHELLRRNRAAQVPEAFAAKVAYLAWTDRQEEARGAVLRGIGQVRARVWPIVTVALGLGFGTAVLLLFPGGATAPLDGALRSLPVAAWGQGLAWLAGSALFAIAAVRLSRRLA
jgi:hypothetical protein